MWAEIIPISDTAVAAVDFLTNKTECPNPGFAGLAHDITGARYQMVWTELKSLTAIKGTKDPLRFCEKRLNVTLS